MELHAGDLRKNRNPALAFQIVRVHDAIGDFFVGAEDAALPQHGIHQRGFSMVDVRNDGDISGILIHSYLTRLTFSGNDLLLMYGIHRL